LQPQLLLVLRPAWLQQVLPEVAPAPDDLPGAIVPVAAVRSMAGWDAGFGILRIRMSSAMAEAPASIKTDAMTAVR
jgi:hypothetical protein